MTAMKTAQKHRQPLPEQDEDEVPAKARRTRSPPSANDEPVTSRSSVNRPPLASTSKRPVIYLKRGRGGKVQVGRGVSISRGRDCDHKNGTATVADQELTPYDDTLLSDSSGQTSSAED
jgi:hypothetical protein